MVSRLPRGGADRAVHRGVVARQSGTAPLAGSGVSLPRAARWALARLDRRASRRSLRATQRAARFVWAVGPHGAHRQSGIDRLADDGGAAIVSTRRSF